MSEGPPTLKGQKYDRSISMAELIKRGADICRKRSEEERPQPTVDIYPDRKEEP